MNLNKLAFVIVLAATLLSACTSAKEKAKRQSVSEAIQALQKINAATQVGVNYQQYGALLIEAKAKVNEAERHLPDGDALKERLEVVMRNYADAARVWGVSISPGFLKADSELGVYIMVTYQVQKDKYEYVDKDEALQAIWRVAAKVLDDLTKMQPQ